MLFVIKMLIIRDFESTNSADFNKINGFFLIYIIWNYIQMHVKLNEEYGFVIRQETTLNLR